MEPKIRFKGFEGEWETPTINEIFEIRNGYTPSKAIKEFWEGGTIPWFRMEDIRENGGILKDSFQHITPLGIKSTGLFEKNSIILATTATIGVHAILIADSLANQRFTNFSIRKSLKNDYNNMFVYYSFFGIDECSKKNTNSGGLLSVNVPFLLKEHFHTPSLDEQKVIAEYFQQLDSLIQSTTKKIESLKQVKAASLQSMFPQEGEKKPRIRFKGFEGDWEKVIVGNLGTTYSGLSGKTKDDFGQGNAKFVTFLNVLTNAIIDTSILESVNVKKGESQNIVKKGDLLFNTSSETPEEVGMCAVIEDELENVYLNSFCFGFRITTNNIDPTFIAYLMRSHIGRRIMSILAQGATRYNLSKNNFCKTELFLPKSKKEQTAIAQYFTNLDKQISLQTQRLEKLKQIKSACLDNMFV